MTITSALIMFLTLIAGHLVADYPLQGDAVARGKNRNLDPALFGVPWYYWLASHAATHALFVGYITGSFWFGLLEFWLHAWIDFGKCEKYYGIHDDQILHVVCKLAIVVMMFAQ